MKLEETIQNDPVIFQQVTVHWYLSLSCYNPIRCCIIQVVSNKVVHIFIVISASCIAVQLYE